MLPLPSARYQTVPTRKLAVKRVKAVTTVKEKREMNPNTD